MSIEVKNVTKKYGELAVLENFSVLIPDSFTCIMGESGSGKTTLVRLILGLEKADAGEINGVPERIGTVFQEDRLSESFCAVVNIRIATGKSDNEIYSCLFGLGLTKEDAVKPVRELSGGQKRRVSIARALLFDAQLYVFDEPFKGLDNDTKERVIEYVRTCLSDKQCIFVTHSEAEAEMLGARVVYVR